MKRMTTAALLCLSITAWSQISSAYAGWGAHSSTVVTEEQNPENTVNAPEQTEDMPAMSEDESDETYQSLVQQAKGRRYHRDDGDDDRDSRSRRRGRSGRSSGGGRNESAPVWGPFISKLSRCAPGCAPVNYHTWRNSPGSCHAEGKAIDVFGFRCGGGTYSAGSGKFSSIVSCMRKSGMKVIYQSSGHYDHGHFSITCHGGSHW